eukprot:CAMPEP_0206234546 /NCGR_PEP_ID=MMETSP0047_2-20121206/12651_1 /ASSEMBLY_ACC=CAM_ASM_000192 /TAXON_ID=195065 /ORGANISM="Chroomonas mesostigmatica_cf, Strain CCMP1168" /LENGTH=229 /DNA_ID=CAMNT_0053658645 /DNA_START=128 /DNA_END=817 /DNA_ORIENTATION=+
MRASAVLAVVLVGLHGAAATSFAPMSGGAIGANRINRVQMDQREQSPVVKRQPSSIPFRRTKSFGELTSEEYQGLVTKLWDASEKGDIQGVTECVQQGAWVNHIRTTSPIQMAPLHMAAFKGHDGVMKKLVDLGADVNIANRQGQTPLHLAAHKGNLNCVKKLVMLGADAGQKCRLGDTALEKADMAGAGNVVEYLKTVDREDRFSLRNVNYRWRQVSRPTMCNSRFMG